MTSARRSAHQPQVSLRGGAVAQFAVLMLGLGVFAAGIVLTVQSRLGLSSWDVLHQGLANQAHVAIGTAVVAVSAAVLVVTWTLRAPLGVGTIANAALVGVIIDGLLTWEPVQELGDA